METAKRLCSEIFQRDGYFIQNDAISIGEIERLRRAVTALPDREEVRRKRRVYGVRNLLDVCDGARELAASRHVQDIASDALGNNAFAVRAVFFD